MSEDVEMSVGIEPLNVYPVDCEAKYGAELCTQLRDMQRLANTLNTNVLAIVEEYKVAVQKFDRVSEQLSKEMEKGTTTTTTMQALVKERDNLKNQRDVLEKRLRLLQATTLPAVNTYMGRVNEVISKKRKLAPEEPTVVMEEEDDVGKMSPEERKLAARKILSAMLKFKYASKTASYKELLENALALFNVNIDINKSYIVLVKDLNQDPRVIQILDGTDIKVDRTTMDYIANLPTFEMQLEQGLRLGEPEFDPAEGRAFGAA